SRTDVHAPGWVKERDPLWRDCFKEDHNHSWYVTGHEKVTDSEGRVRWASIWKKVERCDLDVYLKDVDFRVRTACSIVYSHKGRNIHCGCNLCTNQVGRRLANRSDRQKAKRALRDGRWDEVV